LGAQIAAMIITNEQLKQIVAAGGGLVVDASTITFAQLRELTATAPPNKATITIKNFASLTAGQLHELASLAPGLVVFDLTT
jgi:hypothetical protein